MSDKIKVETEIPIKASENMLFQYISTASGLSEWFADDVGSSKDIFTFDWSGELEKAELVTKRPSKVRFRWIEEDEGKYYFEFRIQVDEITKDVSLIIVDFAEEDEIEETKMFWESKISELKTVIGAE